MKSPCHVISDVPLVQVIANHLISLVGEVIVPRIMLDSQISGTVSSLPGLPVNDRDLLEGFEHQFHLFRDVVYRSDGHRGNQYGEEEEEKATAQQPIALGLAIWKDMFAISFVMGCNLIAGSKLFVVHGLVIFRKNTW